MKTTQIIGLLLIVAGVLGLAYGGFSYTKETTGLKLGSLEVKVQENRVRLAFDAAWLEANPLTATALREEVLEWERIGHELKIPGLDDIVLAQEPVLTE